MRYAPFSVQHFGLGEREGVAELKAVGLATPIEEEVLKYVPVFVKTSLQRVVNEVFFKKVI